MIAPMTPEERKQMAELVQQIQDEKDHQKFMWLVEQLNALLDRRELRFPASKE
jgi:hypothetical protein